MNPTPSFQAPLHLAASPVARSAARATARRLSLAAALGTALVLAACGGDRDPLLGGPDIGRVPAVTTTSPATATPAITGVDTRATVSATFSQAMLASSITSTSFTLACPAATAVPATVGYDVATRTATLTPTAPLPPSTSCVATLAPTISDAAGTRLAAAYSWSFVTGIAVAADTTRPTVLDTTPALGSTGVATNSRISATFSEAMAPATLSATSFTVTNTTLGTPVAGTVSYDAASRTALFTPGAAGAPVPLAASTLYTATLGTAATDVAGNGLAGNTAVLPAAGAQVWTFNTGAAADSTAPTITVISPTDGSTGQCLSGTVSATFSEPMNPATVTSANFGVTDAGVAVPGSVSYDAVTRVASFTPTAAAGFAASRSFVVTIGTGVQDLAGNPMAAARSFGFSTGTQPCISAPPLGTAASFGAFGGGAGVTNQGTNTVVAGNLGTTAACTLVTGLHDAANVYTETPLNVGVVNGNINCGPPAPGTLATLAVATQALADAQTAYNALAALPPGSDPGAGQLGGLVLAPGVYTAAGGTFAVTSGDLTLDAQGNANAVWVFQTAAALTVGLPATPRRVLLINGAQARNVFWQVGSAGRVEDGSTMVGTVIAPAGVTFSTPGQALQTTLIGRAIGLTASVTLVNTTIVAP